MPPPMTAILRRLTPFLPLSVTSGIRRLPVGGLVTSGKRRRVTAVACSPRVDGCAGRGRGRGRRAAEDVPKRALQARVPERMARRRQDRRTDELTRHRELPGALGAQ